MAHPDKFINIEFITFPFDVMYDSIPEYSIFELVSFMDENVQFETLKSALEK
jgi:hypothetical protein